MNNAESEEIFAVMGNGSGSKLAIPEVNKGFIRMPTNSVLMPIFDQESGQVVFWVNIQQGLRFSRSVAFQIYAERVNCDLTSRANKVIFGNDPEHSLGIIMSPDNYEYTYKLIGEEPLLELGEGMGGEAEINDL